MSLDSKERAVEVCKTDIGHGVFVVVTGFNTARLVVRDNAGRMIVTIDDDQLDALGWALKELVEDRPHVRDLGPVKPPYGSPERLASETCGCGHLREDHQRKRFITDYTAPCDRCVCKDFDGACDHESLTGVDATDVMDPDKVWRCESCKALLVHDGDGWAPADCVTVRTDDLNIVVNGAFGSQYMSKYHDRLRAAVASASKPASED